MRSVKLARTIADLAGSEGILSVHLAEALHAARSSEIDGEISGWVFHSLTSRLAVK
ncbi:MAG TPA: hypothetical protein VK897_02120 [Anaerolineales bacterium]|nr:hypothetical protein [Anaerolineales bacterium]